MNARRRSAEHLRQLAERMRPVELAAKELQQVLDENQNDGDGSFTAETFNSASAVVRHVVELCDKLRFALDVNETTVVGRRRRKP